MKKDHRKVTTDSSARYYGIEVNDRSLVPEETPLLGHTRFDNWLNRTGGADPIHRHNAQAFIYVLQGSVVMQLKGSKEVKLMAGQTFYEDTDDVHLVGRNASKTDPARFLVFLIKDKGVPAFIPTEP